MVEQRAYAGVADITNAFTAVEPTMTNANTMAIVVVMFADEWFMLVAVETTQYFLRISTTRFHNRQFFVAMANIEYKISGKPENL